MNPRSAIQKGRELENFWKELLRITGLDTRAYRTPGSGSGKEKGDVATDIEINGRGMTTECKNTKKFPHDSLLQAKKEAGNYNIPLVLWHPPQKPLDESMIVINCHDFLEIIKKAKEPVLVNPDKTTQYKLQRLIQSAREVLKELEN